MTSVLIPNFNGAPYIEECIHSLMYQLQKGDEIVVVDDHSTDDSLPLLQSCAQENPSVVVSSNPKKGGASARNHAFNLSKGECIQWMDIDDFLGKDKLSLCTLHIKKYPTQLHTCPWHSFEGGLRDRAISDDVDWNTIPEFSSPAEWLARDTFMALHCYAGHRTLFEQAGPWDESLTINQDGEYFARVVATSQGVRFTHETEVFYRRLSSGSVSRFSPEKADSLYRSTESMVRTAIHLEDSEQMQQMAANRWQHFIYTVYPSRGDLIAKAENQLKHLPKPNISNPNAVSPLSKLVSNVLGWKTLSQTRLLRARLQSR